METEDLKTISQIGQALWSDPQYSHAASREALAAISPMNLSSEHSLEKASLALLNRATRDGSTPNLGGLDDPFYRLLPEERFVLVTLHLGRWSYQRLAKILGLSVEKVTEIAWAARLHLASLSKNKNGHWSHPISPGTFGASCPEYHIRSPWTQKFLDEEMKSRERLFLQNHLMACSSCRYALNVCRDIYFSVEKVIPHLRDEKEVQKKVHQLRDAWSKARTILNPMTFLDSLRIFTKRREIQLVLLFALVAILASLLN